MAIYIAHAAADRSTARSLASFLKGQSLPVRTTKAEVMTPLTKQAESVIMVWSRDMARTLKSSGASSQKLLADARTILVDVDGQNVPEMARSTWVYDGSVLGNRARNIACCLAIDEAVRSISA